MKVSVVIPTRGDRMESLQKCVESILDTTQKQDVEIVIVADGELDHVERYAIDCNCKFVSVPDAPGALHCWNEGAANATGDIFFLGADDLVFHRGWLEHGLNVMMKMNGHGVVGVNDMSPNAGKLATHYFMSRSYAVNELGGVMAIPAYGHCWMDTEITDRALRDKRLMYAEKAVVEHNHPLWEKSDMDDTYAKGQETYAADGDLYKARKEAGFPNEWQPYFSNSGPQPKDWGKVAVCSRVHKYPEGEFHNAWSMMLVQGLEQGDTLLVSPIGKPAHLAGNIAVRGLLNSHADSILMVDDDMHFTSDSLRRLRSNPEGWEYDLLMGFCTHKTIPPHAVVLTKTEEQPGPPLSLRGEHYSAWRDIPDNSIVDVDAVGLAFTLIRRQVFEAMVNEYGALYTPFFEWGKFEEGEDIKFSRWCREHGFKLGVDTGVKITHIGKYAFGWDTFHDYLEQESRTQV